MGSGLRSLCDRQIHPALYRLCEESSLGLHKIRYRGAFFQLPPYTVWKEFEEQYEGAYEEEYDEEDWDNSADEWESFEKTILCQTYREEFGDFKTYKEWQRRTNRGIQQDIGLFTGLEALRLFSAEYQDMTFLRAMPLLRVLEVVESSFVSLEGIDDLTRLKQLCCWFA